MGDIKEDLYQKRADRLKQLLEDLNIPQSAFTDSNKDLPGDADTFWPSYISSLVNNKHGKHIDEDTAQRLIDLVLKNYGIRWEYLMCNDNWKTETEKELALASKESYETDTLFHGLKLFLENYGYFLVKGCAFNAPKNVSQEEAKRLVQENTMYMIYRGSELISKYDPDQFDRLCDDIEKVTAVLISRH